MQFRLDDYIDQDVAYLAGLIIGRGITWGHLNMGRDFREHQLNIFAEPFLSIGFSLDYKQKILEEFVAWDKAHLHDIACKFCPGVRRTREKKPSDQGENNREKLDARLVGRHFDSYWQICKALGCGRVPPTGSQPPTGIDDDVDEAEGQ